MIKPLIAILLDYDEKRVSDGGYSDFPWYALRIHYSKAIAMNGGIPVHIGYEHNLVEKYAHLFDGFIMPGGDYDINPSYYNESVSKEAEVPEFDNRHKFEFKLIRHIIAQKVPLLAICAGHQLLNVALGGSLYQDIASSIDTNIEHRHNNDISEDWHNIIVSKKSRLYKIVGKERYKVNSHHHQSIKNLGSDLEVSAIAEDGIIEAIEHTKLPFCIGVEWHPEYQKNSEDKKLINEFISEAQKYSLNNK